MRGPRVGRAANHLDGLRRSLLGEAMRKGCSRGLLGLLTQLGNSRRLPKFWLSQRACDDEIITQSALRDSASIAPCAQSKAERIHLDVTALNQRAHDWNKVRA